MKAEVQGAWVDGELGRVLAKPSKVVRYIRLGLELLCLGKASQKELQIIGGGFVYISMFRRPLLGSLNQIWRSIVLLEEKRKGTKIILKREVIQEIARFITLIPLAFIDLRSPFDSIVTASDASTMGGGVSVSKALTGYGLAASQSYVRGDFLWGTWFYSNFSNWFVWRNFRFASFVRYPRSSNCWSYICGNVTWS